MPPPHRTKCKIDGCNNPPHTFPGGSRHTFCSEHLYLRNTKSRGGLPPMTGQMRAILQYLREAKNQDWPFIKLEYPYAHRRTLNILVDRGWISEYQHDDGFYYGIRENGLHALEVYEPVLNRSDGICPRCNERPRFVNGNGRLENYCLECERARGRARSKRLQMDGNYHPMCTQCKAKPRRQYRSGRYSKLCLACDKARARHRAEIKRATELDALSRGDPISLCQHCHEKPRRVFKNSISNYCDRCTKEYARKYKLRRAMQPLMLRKPKCSPLKPITTVPIEVPEHVRFADRLAVNPMPLLDYELLVLSEYVALIERLKEKESAP